MWQGREGPLNYIEALKEAPLGWLQGMTNGNYNCMSPVGAYVLLPA